MNLKNLVPQRNTCNKLVKLGWKTETLAYWVEMEDGTFEVVLDFVVKDLKGVPLIPAPTSSELGEMLPSKIGDFVLNMFKHPKRGWICIYNKQLHRSWDYLEGMEPIEHENETECRALTLIHLIENKHLTL